MTTDPTADSRAEQRYALLFAVRRSRRYHLRRAQFFVRFNSLAAFLTAASGSAAFATVFAGHPWAMWLALLTAVCGALELSFQTTAKARQHTELARAFTTLERDMALAGEALADEQLAAFTARRLEIELEEPPALTVLDALCHNAEVRARGHGDEELVDLSLAQRVLASLLDLRPHLLRKRGDAAR